MPWLKIHQSAHHGETKEIERLLADHPEIINELTENHDTPVQLACSAGQVSTVKLLVDRGADLSIPDRFNNTLLHTIINIIIAMDNGKADCFRGKIEDYYQILEIILQKDINLLTIDDTYQAVHIRAAEILVNLGQVNPKVMKVLSACLGDRNKDVCMKAAEVLAKLEPGTPKVREIFFDRLHDRSPEVRIRAAKALLNVSKVILPKKIFEIICGFMASLNYESLDVKKYAVDSLASACMAIPEIAAILVVPVLVDFLEHESQKNEFKIHLINSLQNICEGMAKKDERKAFRIAEQIEPVLEKMMFKTRSRWEAIGELVSSQTSILDLKKHAANALVGMCGAIPLMAPKIVLALITSLRDEENSEEFKIHLLSSLANMPMTKEIAKQIEPVLESVYRSESGSVNLQQQAVKARARILATPNQEPPMKMGLWTWYTTLSEMEQANSEAQLLFPKPTTPTSSLRRRNVGSHFIGAKGDLAMNMIAISDKTLNAQQRSATFFKVREQDSDSVVSAATGSVAGVVSSEGTSVAETKTPQVTSPKSLAPPSSH